MRFRLTILFVGIMSATSAHADFIFDNMPGNIHSSTSLPVLAPVPPLQAWVTEFTVPAATPGNVAWEINEIDMAASEINGTAIAIGVQDSTSNGFSFLGSGPDSVLRFGGAAGIRVSPGTTVIIALLNYPSSLTWYLNAIGDIGPVGLDADAFANPLNATSYNVNFTEQERPAFRVIASPIPEPSSLLLLVSVVCATAMVKRRRARQ